MRCLHLEFGLDPPNFKYMCSIDIGKAELSRFGRGEGDEDNEKIIQFDMNLIKSPFDLYGVLLNVIQNYLEYHSNALLSNYDYYKIFINFIFVTK